MAVIRRIVNLFHRAKVDQEIEAELRSHIEMRTADNIAAGMSPEEARRQAALRFGSRPAMKERVIAVDAHMFLDSLWQDLCYGLRTLRKSPAFTAAAVLTLALGIGANTAIFSVIDSVLLSNLPVKDPQQLVFLTNPDEQGLEIGFGDGNRDFITYPEFRELEQSNQVFSGVLAASNFTSSIPVELQAADSAANGAPAHVSLVSGSYFSVLGVTPILGRVFGIEVDKLRGANPVAVISYAFWQGRFGGAGNVIGRRIRILNTSYSVVAVA
ncbi:MAG TPA: ABC transporter permease, partial [Candidatus Acidoferrales bacterium]|nr:ABC transporter permease [Candidatus Acidoferrales bacterium]